MVLEGCFFLVGRPGDCFTAVGPCHSAANQNNDWTRRLVSLLTLAIGRYENTIANTAVLESFFNCANDEKLLSFVLRTRTAIGQVGYLFNKPVATEIDTTVTLVGQNVHLTLPFQNFNSTVCYSKLNKSLSEDH